MNWQAYEKELFDYFKTSYPDAVITFNAKRIGRYSKRERQIDILVEDTIADYPVSLIVDAKHFRRNVDVKHVESFIAMVEDLEAERGLLITSKGFSTAAINRAYYGPAKIELDIINFSDIKANQALVALPYSGNRTILTMAPIGWVIQPGTSMEFLAALYQRGRTLEEANKNKELIYVNTSPLSDKIQSIDDLLAIQTTNTQKYYGPIRTDIKPGPTRKDNYPTRIRIAYLENVPFIEVIGYIEAEDFIFFFVLITPIELQTKNIRKLEFLLKYSQPAVLNFDNSRIIENAIAEVSEMTDNEAKAEKHYQIAIWYSEMQNDKRALEHHREAYALFSLHYDNTRRLIGHELLFGNDGAAKNIAQYLFGLEPTNPVIADHIVSIYLDLEKGKSAEELIEELIIKYNGNNEVLVNLYFHLANLQHE
ncbi:MAG: restriction endonuclease [Fibrobacter sp.]|nr:restriction endonuclease [Fibrobacter sp.]